MARNMNPYAILGIPIDSDEDTIRAAFRRKALECHPDANPDDPAAADRFIALRDAYEHLIATPRTDEPIPWVWANHVQPSMAQQVKRRRAVLEKLARAMESSAMDYEALREAMNMLRDMKIIRPGSGKTTFSFRGRQFVEEVKLNPDGSTTHNLYSVGSNK